MRANLLPMKIGLLTFHQSANYGATLQAYALWKTIRSLGHEVEIIDYAPLRSSIEYWKCVVKSKHIGARARQLLQHKDFIRKKTQLSARVHRSSRSLKKQAASYDVVVCGSDEIWNIYKPYIGMDPNYFLGFVDAQITRKISYAASFGSTLQLGAHRLKLAALLNSFERIGVRDKNSERLVSECGQQSVKVLDPTFLTTYEEEESERPFKNPYLLLYGYKLSPSENAFIKKVAAAKKLTIISIGNHNSAAAINRIDVSPAEWINFFKHASHVMTSYFHGIIFSILYKKDFHALLKTNKHIKMNDLLEEFDLNDRVYDESSVENDFQEKIDYSRLAKKWAELRHASKLFLANSLISPQIQSPSLIGIS